MSELSETAWEKALLGSLLSKVVGGGTPSRQVPEFWNGTIPWASVKDFSDGVSRLESTEEYITKEGLASGAANLIGPGVAIVCTRMAVGRAAITVKPTAINQDLKALYPSDQINADYLLLILNHIRTKLENVAVGSTVKGVTLSQLNGLQVDLPSLPEQRKIAKIISTVDNLIEKTQALIDKYQSIKQGMMHDLFTRGVDESGQLRPSYEEAPHLYKESELGWIPKEWEVCRFDKLLRSNIRDFGSFSMTNLIDFVEEGVPFIKSESVNYGKINKEKVSFITPHVHHLLGKSKVVKGDLLFTKIGAICRAAIYDGSMGECNSNAATAKIQVNQDLADNQFFKYKLMSDRVVTEFHSHVISTPPRINLGEINAFLFKVPVRKEQEHLSAKLLAIDGVIDSESKYVDKLKTKKAGLMQDLLTGKVRVKVDGIDKEGTH